MFDLLNMRFILLFVRHFWHDNYDNFQGPVRFLQKFNYLSPRLLVEQIR
jgi:hypothetical protein